MSEKIEKEKKVLFLDIEKKWKVKPKKEKYELFDYIIN